MLGGVECDVVAAGVGGLLVDPVPAAAAPGVVAGLGVDLTRDVAATSWETDTFNGRLNGPTVRAESDECLSRVFLSLPREPKKPDDALLGALVPSGGSSAPTRDR